MTDASIRVVLILAIIASVAATAYLMGRFDRPARRVPWWISEALVRVRRPVVEPVSPRTLEHLRSLIPEDRQPSRRPLTEDEQWLDWEVEL